MSGPTKRQIQFVRSLQSRKTRDELNLFVAEGPKVVAEILAADNVQVQEVFASPHWVEQHATHVHRSGGAIIETSDQALSRMTSLSGPNQVIAIFSKPHFPGPPSATSRLTILLDGVQDPGNVGTIVRCADWFGAQNVICSPGCADVFNTKVVQSTMGSIARVRVDYITNIPAYLDQLPANTPILAATLDGENIQSTLPPVRALLIIGSESHGISPPLRERATRHITIPRLGQAESLNAAVAAGILMAWFNTP